MINEKKDRTDKLKRNIMVAVFCAIAYASEFVFHFKVSFLSFDIKDAIIALAAMIFGPVSALLMGIIVSLLEFFIISDTGVYGLIMNALSTCTFTALASLIYKYKRTLFGAIIGLLSACFATVAIMAAANLLITPYYMKTTVDVVKGMLPTLILPFNLLKCTFNASVVMLLYKPLITALRRARLLPSRKASEPIMGNINAHEAKTHETHGNSPKIAINLIVSIAAILIIALSVILILAVLGGSFEFGN